MLDKKCRERMLDNRYLEGKPEPSGEDPYPVYPVYHRQPQTLR